MKGVWDDVLAGEGLVSCYEAPALLTEMPVDDGERDEVLEALQLPGDQCPVRPRAGGRDREVISALLGRELGAGLPRDEVPEGADLALELAGLVVGLDPIGDTALRWGGVSRREELSRR